MRARVTCNNAADGERRRFFRDGAAQEENPSIRSTSHRDRRGRANVPPSKRSARRGRGAPPARSRRHPTAAQVFRQRLYLCLRAVFILSRRLLHTPTEELCYTRRLWSELPLPLSLRRGPRSPLGPCTQVTAAPLRRARPGMPPGSRSL